MVCTYLSSADLTTLLLQISISSAQSSNNMHGLATTAARKKYRLCYHLEALEVVAEELKNAQISQTCKYWPQTSLRWSSSSPESPAVRNEANSYWCLETEGVGCQVKVRRRGIEPIRATSNSHEQRKCLEVLQDPNAWSLAISPRQEEAPQEILDFRRNFPRHRTEAQD